MAQNKDMKETLNYLCQMSIRMQADDAIHRYLRAQYGDVEEDYHTLAKLLGYKDGRFGHDFVSKMTYEDYETCKQLHSVHGYTIFKMLCHKYGLTELLNTCAEA